MLQKIRRYSICNLLQLKHIIKLEHLQALLILILQKSVFVSDYTRRDFIGQHYRFQLVLYFNRIYKICFRLRELQHLGSIVMFFSSRTWLERELFDLFGIFFLDHPQLQRLLTNYGFKGHPLRKDFPLTGFTEIHYLEIRNEFIFAPVILSQNYRNFYFTETWKKGR
jgi:NADH-quinone oxidoreductase subunit C